MNHMLISIAEDVRRGFVGKAPLTVRYSCHSLWVLSDIVFIVPYFVFAGVSYLSVSLIAQ